MKYMGSKTRIAKDILHYIKTCQKPGQTYFEPFVGGANVIDKVGGRRIGNDTNYYLIEMYRALQQGWLPPELVTEEDYTYIKNCHKFKIEDIEPALIGYVGFAMSFGGKFFGGYRRDRRGQHGDIENMKIQSRRAYNSIIKQSELIKGVVFTNLDYREVPLVSEGECFIYCDPPYAKTTGYSDSSFDHDIFFDWCRSMKDMGHTILISEYTAPPDFVTVWEKEIPNTISDSGSKKATEKLFMLPF